MSLILLKLFLLKVIKSKEEKGLPETFTQPTTLSQIVVPLGAAINLIGATVGAGLGYSVLIPGICQAAEIKKGIITAILSLSFIACPLVFSLIIAISFNYIVSYYQYTAQELAFRAFAGFTFCGFGFGMAAYSLGLSNRTLVLARAKQAKFTTQFFLCNIFIEIITILTLVMGFVSLYTLPYPDNIRFEPKKSP